MVVVLVALESPVMAFTVATTDTDAARLRESFRRRDVRLEVERALTELLDALDREGSV